MCEKIKLDADETMLLLITKNWEHKDVPFYNNNPGDLEYIQRCCDFRCQCDNAQLFAIYRDLCIKLLSPSKYQSILEEIMKHITGFYSVCNQQAETFSYVNLMQYIFSALAGRIIINLELDESLILRKEN